MMNIENIEILLEGIGFERVGTEYAFKGVNISRVGIVLQILKERQFQIRFENMTEEEKAKELEILARKKQAQSLLVQKQSFTNEIAEKSKLDRIEKNKDNADRPMEKGRSLNFGAKKNTYKDIGVDLNAQKGG